jgi:2-C-methyl-D-erythritol 4-phosphate cytidylyltransferase / 2-C-methyl-D-erythritol 2,4-cyclodiphosphate synthase
MTRETRVGLGIDVHPFTTHDNTRPLDKRAIRLCGVEIPYERALQGHSDADAGLHALVDAILGAIGEGDIGSHFPDDDIQWKGADSSRFLLHAFKLLTQRGGTIINLDVTILAEKPRIAPHRETMREHVASLLKLDKDRVSIKATTTEKLGFIGRAEGIAAQAIVAVSLPV